MNSNNMDFVDAGDYVIAVICAAVIPCFNEAETVGPLVLALRPYLPWIMVVDDGSTDDTAMKAKDAGATVVRHERNRGKGAAFQTGLSHALNLGFDWAATLDGDGQHSPADLPALLQCAGETGAPLIIGNRMHQAEAMPWLRRCVNHWMSRKLSQRARRHLPDTQSGFRLIHLQTWASLPLSARRFEVESEMLMAFLAANRSVEFVPVQVIAAARKSRIRPFADTVRWLKWWRKIAKPALSPRPSPPMGARERGCPRPVNNARLVGARLFLQSREKPDGLPKFEISRPPAVVQKI
ncbi:MAG TPA: glycosyltransferase family 2 protein [Candidatus Acidoferrum sp.]|nr:glycosyltransferase family 2 protein [Candidatus Acidoferrum sp.]